MSCYVELHCHSYYSLLDGASSTEELVRRAAALGMPALALTDHDGLYGAVEVWRATRGAGLHPIIGAEVTLDDNSHLTLLAETQAGYSNLCRLISRAQLVGQKREPVLTPEMLQAHAGGLICLSGCRQSPVVRAIRAKDYRKAVQIAETLRDIFGPEQFYIELQRHLLPDDGRLTSLLARLANHIGVEVVATNDAHYATPAGQPLHDVLTCIRHHTTLESGRSLLWPNAERYLKSPAQMAELFADLPEAVANTRHIAERCWTSLDLSAYRLPDFPVPNGETPFSYLYQLCQAGARRRYQPITHRPEPVEGPAMSRQLAHELDVIQRAGLTTFFLVVWDICRFCQQHGIPCQGRGSAANSLVAYVLGITAVDPLAHDLLFERFLSEESNTTPDIDLDISTSHRDQVIEYVYETYGEDHTAMVCNVVTFRTRSAIRDVGKVLGFPPDIIDQMAKAIDPHSDAPLEEQLVAFHSPSSNPWTGTGLQSPISNPWTGTGLQSPPSPFHSPFSTFLSLVREIQGVPRHLSIHNGGMLITACPLIDIVPVEHATMPGRVVVQWNKDSVEDAGLIKVDLLGLRTLSLIHDAVELIREHEGTEVDIQALPLDDPKVYDLLCAADTIGAFQVESRAQAQLLPRLKPRRFEDIVISVAIIRPGPIQGNMVHPYLRRRAGEEPVEYLHPALEKPLAETLGVMLYQEQILKVAMAVAGFSPGEADALRRAMRRPEAPPEPVEGPVEGSRARSKEAIEALRPAFIQGAQARGIGADVAETIFDQIAGYAGYGFCKSHAASFALIAYATCWLKVYHPAAFYCALANSYPLGFYPLGVVLGDARRHHVSILRPDLHRSQTICTLEPTMPDDSAIRNTQYAIRLGFRFVKGVGEAGGERIETAREAGAFRDLHDFCRRTRLPRRAVERLILVGAMDDWGVPRRKLLWELGKTEIREEGLDLELPPDDIELPTLTRSELVDLEYSYLGLNVGEHVMALYRDRLAAQGVLDSRELASVPDGATVRVAGLQVIRQRPSTAHGIVFVTLESARGLINVVVKPAIYERYRHVWHPEAPPEPVEGPVEGWRGCRLLVVTGVIERRQGVVSVIARHVTGLSVEDNQAGVGGYRRRP